MELVWLSVQDCFLGVGLALSGTTGHLGHKPQDRPAVCLTGKATARSAPSCVWSKQARGGGAGLSARRHLLMPVESLSKLANWLLAGDSESWARELRLAQMPNAFQRLGCTPACLPGQPWGGLCITGF